MVWYKQNIYTQHNHIEKISSFLIPDLFIIFSFNYVYEKSEHVEYIWLMLFFVC